MKWFSQQTVDLFNNRFTRGFKSLLFIGIHIIIFLEDGLMKAKLLRNNLPLHYAILILLLIILTSFILGTQAIVELAMSPLKSYRRAVDPGYK